MRRQVAMRLGAISALFLLGLVMIGTPACSGPPCRANKVCTCDGSENNTHTCPGGNCVFPCNGSGSCSLACPKGNCVAESNQSNVSKLDCSGGGCEFLANAGNATLNCSGNNCKMVCTGTATCRLLGCTKNCSLSCQGTGKCVNACKDPSCTTTKLQ